MKNSVQKGEVRIISFKKRGLWYAVALEFNIIETGKSFSEAMQQLQESIEGYVETVKKANLRPHPLNQIPLKEYEQIWKNHEKKINKKGIPSPFYVGTLNLAAYA